MSNPFLPGGRGKFTGPDALISQTESYDFRLRMYAVEQIVQDALYRIIPSDNWHLRGGQHAGDNLYLSSTSHTTKGNIYLGSASVYDELNDRLGLGTTTVPHAGVGWAKVALDGANASANGPHVQFTTASDNYPLLQVCPYSHDDVELWFDCYWDGGNMRASDTSAAGIRKNADELEFFMQAGLTAGNAFAVTTRLILFNDGAHQLVNSSYVHLSKSNTSSTSNWVDVSFTNENDDQLGECAASVFTAAHPGIYAVSWSIDTANSAWPAGGRMGSYLSRNNQAPGTAGYSWQGQWIEFFAAGTGYGTSVGSALVKLAATDTLRLKYYANRGAGVATALDNYDSETFLQIAKVH